MQHLKHPKGLYVLFLTEMWERFSFYGLRALLVLYLTQAMAFTDTDAYSLFGAYAALVYATPVIGGLVGDKVLGLKKAVFLGGVLIMLGHFTLAIPGNKLFYIGLAFIVCGTGYLKSCISSLVGELYPPADPRRDSGFTIFYMGINLGAFAAGILVGIVAKLFGWHYGFGLAGIGMMFGLITYLYGLKHLDGIGEPPETLKRTKLTSVWLLSFLAVPCFGYLLQLTELVGWMLVMFIVVSAITVIIIALNTDREQRKKLYALSLFIIFAVGFFSLFEQAASSITLFTERGVDRTLFGYTIPTPAFQSLNPLFILIFAPMFAYVWIKLADKNREPTTQFKFFIGLLLVSFGFGVLAFGAMHVNRMGLSNMWWLVLAYFLHTAGELCLSPVGLSVVTKLAPRNYVGMMMGIWFLAMSTSNYLAAALAKLSAVTVGVTVITEHYAHSFWLVFYIGIGITFLMLLCMPLIKRLTKYSIS